jgi:hypothetical protein
MQKTPKPVQRASAFGSGSIVLLRNLLEPDRLDQLAHPLAADPVCLGEAKEVVVGGAANVDRLRLERGADLVQGRAVIAIALAVT